MAAVDGAGSLKRGAELDGEELFVRKKLKIQDLPISQGQRKVIEGLVLAFKKKGGFDTLRKEAYKQFTEGVSVSIGLRSCCVIAC